MLFSADAFALNSYRARDYSCAQLQALVQSEKVIHIKAFMWGARYASNKKFCATGDTAITNAYFAARDTRWCNPGIYCRFKTNP